MQLASYESEHEPRRDSRICLGHDRTSRACNTNGHQQPSDAALRSGRSIAARRCTGRASVESERCSSRVPSRSGELATPRRPATSTGTRSSSIEPAGVERSLRPDGRGVYITFIARIYMRPQQHRAGRGPRDVPLPRRVLQRELRRSGPRRGDPRQAPQRPDRHREARVPEAVREVRRPRAAARPRGLPHDPRRTRSGSHRARRRSRASARRASTRPRRRASFLDAIRVRERPRRPAAPRPTSASFAAPPATRSSSAASTGPPRSPVTTRGSCSST